MGALFFDISLASGYLINEGKLRIAGSLKRLNKKGSTLYILSGPPKLNNITALFIYNLLLYELNFPSSLDQFQAIFHVQD